MGVDILITALKVVGAIVTALLGIVGVLVNFKDAEGKLTKWGYLVIVGIAASSLTVVGAVVAEGYKAQLTAAEQLARTQQLLQEVNRAIQPITQLKMSYWVRLPKNNRLFSDYTSRVSKSIRDNIDAIRASLPQPEKKWNDTSVIVASSDGEPITIHIGKNSSLMPNVSQSYMGNLGYLMAFSVYIFKNPIKPEQFSYVISLRDGGPDWIATGPPVGIENQLWFNYQNQELEIFGSTTIDKKYWLSNGKISSIIDLKGAQLFLVPPGKRIFGVPVNLKGFTIPEIVNEAFASVELKTIVLEFAEGREFWLSEKDLIKSNFREGYPAYSIILPETDEGLRALGSLGNS